MVRPLLDLYGVSLRVPSRVPLGVLSRVPLRVPVRVPCKSSVPLCAPLRVPLRILRCFGHSTPNAPKTETRQSLSAMQDYHVYPGVAAGTCMFGAGHLHGLEFLSLGLRAPKSVLKKRSV